MSAIVLAARYLFPALLLVLSRQAVATPQVIAKGAGVVPGAIICPDFKSVQAAVHGYTAGPVPEPNIELFNPKVVQGDAYHGYTVGPAKKPNLELYGCSLVAPGTVMTLDGEDPGGAPMVTATLPGGRTVKGVSLRDMVEIFVRKPEKTVSQQKAHLKANNATGDSPKKIYMVPHAGSGTILSHEGINTDFASVTFTRQQDDFLDDCKRNSSTCAQDFGNDKQKEECRKVLAECISELTKEAQGRVYKVSAVCSSRVITTELYGGSYQLWKLEPHDGYVDTDWKDLKTGKLTGDCFNCARPHLVSALEVLCPKLAREPVKHEEEASPEASADLKPQAQPDVDAKLSYCVTPEAQYGRYSSFDGGKSANAILLEKCPQQTLAWVESCERSGDSHGNCIAKILIIAQVALKQFGK